MGKIVYTREKIRAIVEENWLNSDPDSNRPLYELVKSARNIVRSSPLEESVNQTKIIVLEEGLARYPQSYAARQRREDLLRYEADRIIQAKEVFELDRVARLVRDLGNYKSAEAAEFKNKLDDLWQMVQNADNYARGVLTFNEQRVRWLLKELRPYKNSEIISGVHRRLKAEQQLSS